MMVEIKHLQQIEAINRCRNFSRAAKELNISQPALSQSIGFLEERLGFRLFDRSAQVVKPTVFGQLAVNLSRSILRDAVYLEHELNRLVDLETGEVRAGVGPLVAEVLLGQTVIRLQTDYPKLSIHTVLEHPHSLAFKLNSGELDLIVCDIRRITLHEDMEIISLPRYQACYTCRTNHPLAHKRHVSFRELFDFPIATTGLPDQVINMFAQRSGLNLTRMTDFPNGFVDVPHNLLPKIIAKVDAIGASIFPIFQKGVERGDLVVLPVKTPEITTDYAVINLKQYTLSPAVQVFKKYIIKTSQELAEKAVPQIET